MFKTKVLLQLFADGDKIDRTGAQALIPPDISREIIQGVPKYSSVMQLGTKAADMPVNQRRVPVLSVLPMAYFVNGDVGRKQMTKMAWDNKYFDAEEIAVIVPIPEAVLDDTNYDIWGEVKPRIMEAIGVTFDSAVFFGTNAPASWPKNILQGATDSSHIVALGTGVDMYDDLLGENGVISLIEKSGFMATGHVAHMGMRGKYRGLRDSNKQPIFTRSMQDKSQYELDGSSIFFPENGVMDDTKALQFSGDFRQLMYAMRQDITYKILDQAVIQDAAGQIIFNLAQQDMVALRAVIRLAWQIPNPINRMEADPAKRYPFAVLTPKAQI